jgi:Type IIA topoisomerase (DNA gyrase/topo II, topoisomerase IV), A subunit
LIFIDELGYVYNLDSSNISITRGQGDPLSKYFQIQDGIHIIGMHSLTEKLCILTMTNHGYGFICLYEDLIVKNKKGKTLLRTKDSYAIKSTDVDLDNDTHYLLITSENYMIICSLQKIPILSKGRGVKLINIPKSSDETIIFSGVIRKGQSLLFSYDSKRSKKLDYNDLKPFFMEKNRRGKKIDKKFLLEKGKTTYNIE